MSINLEGFIRRKTTIELGGKDWIFTELSLSDLAMFRARVVKERKVYLSERRKEIIEEAKQIGEVETLKLLEHLDRPVTEDDVDSQMESTEGIGYLIYLSLKYEYPEITEENALQMVNINKIEKITGAMFGEPDKKKPTAKKKKESDGQQP